MDRLFTYGSLKPGGPNEHVLDGNDGEWQAATVTGHLVEVGWGAALGYPALQLDINGEEIPGFVFASDHLSDDWHRLDEFEGPEYRRVIAEIRLDSGETVAAHIYVISTLDSSE